MEVRNDSIGCKYCQSPNVIKYGKYKAVQYYYCKDCKRKFAGLDTIPKMQYSTSKIADVLNIDSARLFMDGWLVHYNFFRPHMSLKDMTPAQVAGVRCPLRNWKDVTEQPDDYGTQEQEG